MLKIDLAFLAGDEVAGGVEQGGDDGELAGVHTGEIHQLQMGDVEVEHDVDARLAGGVVAARWKRSQAPRPKYRRRAFLIDSALGGRRARGIDGGGEIAGPRLHFVAVFCFKRTFRGDICHRERPAHEGEGVGVFRQKAEFAKPRSRSCCCGRKAAGAGGEDGHGVVAFRLRPRALALTGDHGTDGHAADGDSHVLVLGVEAFGIERLMTTSPRRRG